MPNWVALSPIVALLTAALVIALLRNYPRLSQLLSASAILLAILLQQLGARAVGVSALLFPSAGSSPDLDLSFHFDSAALFFSYITLIAFLARLLLRDLHSEGSRGTGMLTAIAGALAFFYSENWVTVIAAWLLVDLGLLLSRLEESDNDRERQSSPWLAFGLSQSGLLLLAAAGWIAALNGSSLRLNEAALDGRAATLLLLAAWVRSGLYPFHLAGDGDSVPGNSNGWWRIALAGLLGFHLFIRGLLVMQGTLEYTVTLYALALFAVGATALLLLGGSAQGQVLGWSTGAVAAPAFLLPFFGPALARPAFAAWLALGFFNFALLAAGARLLRAQTQRQPWVQVLYGVALLAAAAAPFTPGFWGRIGLYAALVDAGQWAILLLLGVAMTVALFPVWENFLQARGSEVRIPRPLEYLGIALLLMPTVAEGLAPFVVVSFLGRPVEDASAFAYDALFHAQNYGLPIVLVGSIVAPLMISFMLAREWQRLRGRAALWFHPISSVLELGGAARVIAQVIESASLLFRSVNNLIEQHPIGWLIFAAIWVALWILNARPGR